MDFDKRNFPPILSIISRDEWKKSQRVHGAKSCCLLRNHSQKVVEKIAMCSSSLTVTLHSNFSHLVTSSKTVLVMRRSSQQDYVTCLYAPLEQHMCKC